MSKKTTVPSIEDRINAGVDHAAHWAAPKVEAALAWAERGLGEGKVQGKAAGEKTSQQVSEAVEKLSPQVRAGLAQASSVLSGAVDKVSPQVQAQLDRLAPAFEGARSKVEGEYVPAASARLATAAGQASKAAHGVKVSPAVERALVNITGDKKAVKKLKKAAEEYARTAEKQLKKQAKKQNKGGKGWIVAGIVVAAGVAAVAVWQLTKPVEDPWKTPAPSPLPKQDTPSVPAPSGADPDLAVKAPSVPGPTPAAGSAAASPAPSVAAGTATVDTVDATEEKVEGIPAPKSAE
ncbi:hypothetical protein AB0333_05160 [Citricoccus sp. NPDC079358]|uniref:hypothetical protein n=1 Tax=Citricoccus sp. NPDC079358 TaxID=3154653 RepID=UPI00344C3790